VLLHADGQTDMTMLTVAFHNFRKAHKNDMCSMCNISVRDDKIIILKVEKLEEKKHFDK
jgi:hypothetical protein